MMQMATRHCALLHAFPAAARSALSIRPASARSWSCCCARWKGELRAACVAARSAEFHSLALLCAADRVAAAAATACCLASARSAARFIATTRPGFAASPPTVGPAESRCAATHCGSRPMRLCGGGGTSPHGSTGTWRSSVHLSTGARSSSSHLSIGAWSSSVHLPIGARTSSSQFSTGGGRS